MMHRYARRLLAVQQVLLALFLLVSPKGVYAQRQYWGVTYPSSSDPASPCPRGAIIRFDSVGLGAVIVARHDLVANGLSPVPGAGLMQASDGRIYYMTQENDLPYRSYILSYDPVTDTATVRTVLGNADFPYKGQRTSSSLVESLPGVIIDATRGYTVGAIFRFDITSDALSLITTIPAGIDGNGLVHYPSFAGTLVRASDGKIYCGVTPWPLSLGKVGRIDPAAGIYTATPLLNPLDGWPLNGGLVQIGDKLYGTTERGGAGASVWFPGHGTICSYDQTTGVYQKEQDLNALVHTPTRGLVAHANGLYYGEALGDTLLVQGQNPPYHGCLFAFDPSTNSVTRLFSHGDAGLGFAVTGLALQPGLLAASNGKLYGSFRNGIFEYDPVQDTVVLRAPLMFQASDGAWQGYGLQAPLIEICRKPNYKPRPATSFNVCAGAHFFYDLQNETATSVAWRRNGVVVPEQSSQLLEFAAISEGEEGVWSCTLTNECGVTEPPAITITVNAGAFATSVISGDTLLCGTGDAAALAGNNGGMWVAPLSSGQTGATTASLSVTQPGAYYVQHQQACGLSMSNIIHVAHLDSARAPNIQGGEAWLCANDSMQLEGNAPGPWGLQTTGVWSTGDSTATTWTHGAGEYYIVVANACSSDTSDQRLVVHAYPEASAPLVTYTDGQGQPADNLLCQGDSMLLQVVPEVFEPIGLSTSHQWYLNGSFVNEQGGDGSLWAHVSAVYELRTTWCGATRVDSIVIEVAEGPPPPAVILPDEGQLVGCDQDTVWLSSQQPHAIWSWVDAMGESQQDTAQAVQVDWGAGNNGFYVLVNYNGCGVGEMDYIQVVGLPAPEVSYEEEADTLCLSAGPTALAAGQPAGGIYSGAGVTGNSFDPAQAGVGAHTITYSYSDGTCTGYAQDVVLVELCAGATERAIGNGITVSPNPNGGVFVLTVAPAQQRGSCSIYNELGQQVGRTKPISTGRNRLGDEGLAPGVYVLRIELNGEWFARQIVVARD